MSHIAAIAFAHYRPTCTKWDGPKELGKGAKELLEIVERVTNTRVEPLKPHYLLNTDCSSMYYFAGVKINNKHSNCWSRVCRDSLRVRNKSSYWVDSADSEEICKGIRVKFACGGCAAGYIFPICIQVSGLTKTEMPDDEFLVFEQ